MDKSISSKCPVCGAHAVDISLGDCSCCEGVYIVKLSENSATPLSTTEGRVSCPSCSGVRVNYRIEACSACGESSFKVELLDFGQEISRYIDRKDFDIAYTIIQEYMALYPLKLEYLNGLLLKLINAKRADRAEREKAEREKAEREKAERVRIPKVASSGIVEVAGSLYDTSSGEIVGGAGYIESGRASEEGRVRRTRETSEAYRRARAGWDARAAERERTRTRELHRRRVAASRKKKFIFFLIIIAIGAAVYFFIDYKNTNKANDLCFDITELLGDWKATPSQYGLASDYYEELISLGKQDMLSSSDLNKLQVYSSAHKTKLSNFDAKVKSLKYKLNNKDMSSSTLKSLLGEYRKVFDEYSNYVLGSPVFGTVVRDWTGIWDMENMSKYPKNLQLIFISYWLDNKVHFYMLTDENVYNKQQKIFPALKKKLELELNKKSKSIVRRIFDIF